MNTIACSSELGIRCLLPMAHTIPFFFFFFFFFSCSCCCCRQVRRGRPETADTLIYMSPLYYTHTKRARARAREKNSETLLRMLGLPSVFPRNSRPGNNNEKLNFLANFGADCQLNELPRSAVVQATFNFRQVRPLGNWREHCIPSKQDCTRSWRQRSNGLPRPKICKLDTIDLLF